MIDYKPFWETLKSSKESTYTLIYHYYISSSTLDKLRKNKPISTKTLNDLCAVFGCSAEEILRYVPNDEDQHPWTNRNI